MKIRMLLASLVALVALPLCGCNHTTDTPPTPPSAPVDPASTATTPAKPKVTLQDVKNFLYDAGSVIQQFNGLALATAPTAETVLAMMGKQGYANDVALIAQKDSTVAASLNGLLANVKTAIATAKANGVAGTPAQQDAVSAAVGLKAVDAATEPIAVIQG